MSASNSGRQAFNVFNHSEFGGPGGTCSKLDSDNHCLSGDGFLQVSSAPIRGSAVWNEVYLLGGKPLAEAIKMARFSYQKRAILFRRPK